MSDAAYRRWHVGVFVALAMYFVTLIPGVGPDHTVLWLDASLQIGISVALCWLCYLRVVRTTTPRIWMLALVSILFTTAGRVVMFSFPIPALREGASPGEPFMLAAYLPLVVLVMGRLLPRLRTAPIVGYVDSLIVASGVTCMAVLIFTPLLDSFLGESVLVNLPLIAYFVLHLTLTTLAIIYATIHRWRPPGDIVPLAAMLLSGYAFAFVAATGDPHPGSVADVFAFTGSLAVAMLPGRYRERVGPTNRLLPLATPLTASFVAVVVLVCGALFAVVPTATAFAGLTIVVTLVRLALLDRAAAAGDAHRMLAETDDLTELANRRSFYGQGEIAARTSSRFAVLLLDLDKFKDVNDSLGHTSGDELLRIVAARMRRAAEPVGIPARLGGDEFAILVPDASVVDVERISARLADELAAPVALDGVRVRISGSIGIAKCPDHGSTLGELLQHADIAMYEAKHQSDAMVSYAPIGSASSRRPAGSRDDLVLLEQINAAIDSDEFTMHYQPIISLADGRPISAEGLIRWQHPERGLLVPADFLPLVRAHRLMHKLTMSALRIIAADIGACVADGLTLPLGLNLFPPTLGDVDLARRVEAEFAARGIPPALLAVEVTEEFVIRDPEQARGVLHQLRQLGVTVSIDDFGTGFSSLARMNGLPVNAVKIDREFVKSIVDDERAAALTRSVIALVHSLGLVAIAEGVEGQECLDLLREFGCDAVQGYFLGSPMTRAELVARFASSAGVDDVRAR